MDRIRVLVPFVLAFAVIAATALGPGGLGCTVHEVSQTGDEPFDERPMLRNLADAVALHAFRATASEAAGLATAMADLEAEPSPQTLTAAQDAWRRTRAAWTRTAVFGFGPTKDATPRIDWWPADPVKIDELVRGDAPIDAASIAKAGASARGLGAIEILLFAPGDDDDVESVLEAMEASPRHAAVARALADDVAVATADLAAAWEPGGGAHAEQLATAGDGSTAYPARKDGTDAIVNESIFVAELVVGDELALPLGLRHDGTPQPDQARSPRADASVADALGHLDAIGAVYLGVYVPDGLATGGGGGLSELVVARGGGDLDRDVRDALSRARTAVAAIPEPLRHAVVDDPVAVQRAYDEVRELKRLLASDVATAVGTTLSFNDNDGD